MVTTFPKRVNASSRNRKKTRYTGIQAPGAVRGDVSVVRADKYLEPSLNQEVQQAHQVAITPPWRDGRLQHRTGPHAVNQAVNRVDDNPDHRDSLIIDGCTRMIYQGCLRLFHAVLDDRR